MMENPTFGREKGTTIVEMAQFPLVENIEIEMKGGKGIEGEVKLISSNREKKRRELVLERVVLD